MGSWSPEVWVCEVGPQRGHNRIVCLGSRDHGQRALIAEGRETCAKTKSCPWSCYSISFRFAALTWQGGGGKTMGTSQV